MPQYPPGYGAPYGQPIPDPTINILIPYLQNLQQLTLMVAKKVEQENHPEQAYSEVIECSNQLWVPDKRGIMHILLDVGFDYVYYIWHDDLYGKEAFFVIGIHNVPDHIIISEKDFYRPSLLLNAIARASGKKLRLYKSERQTSELVRQHISSKAKEFYVPFHLGWYQSLNGWQFEMINGSTHGRRFHNPPIPSRHKGVREGPAPTISLLATEQILLLFETVTNAGIRCSLFLWFHAAVLTSLVSDLGFRIPMGLGLYSACPSVRRYIEAIFAWYDDTAVTLATPYDRFINLLVERKDQPLLLIDCINQKNNSELVLNAIQSGEIPLSAKKNSAYPALASLPTLLSDDVTLLSASAYFATIEINDDDLACCSSERLSALNKYITDYLLGFTGFVADHIDDLQKHLSNGIDDVMNNASEIYSNLTYEGMTTLGILFGVRKILSDYYQSLAPNHEMEARMHNLIYPTNQDTFLNALSNAAECKLNAEDLVSFFLSNLNRLIEQERFDSRSIYDARIHTPCAEGKAGIVYSDETHISLTRKAFVSVCRACGASGPMLLRELSAADTLKGSRVNNETSQTRITVYDVNGQAKSVHVYKFERQSLADYY